MKSVFLGVTVFVCGAVVMAFEILGSRILGPVAGTSIVVWTSIISTILISLSLGYWLGGRLADRKPRHHVLAIVILASAIFLCIVALAKGLLLEALSRSLGSYQTVAISSSLLLFFIPGLLLGMVSPFAARLKMKEVGRGGRTVGNLYALSTLGSILGTFLSGFFLIPRFNITHIIYVLAVPLFLVSIGLFCLRESAGQEEPGFTSSQA
jgi:predicted membrane-bound spermidine synthase